VVPVKNDLSICPTINFLRSLHILSSPPSRRLFEGNLTQIEFFKFLQTDISQLRMNIELVIILLDPLTHPLLCLFQTGEFVEPDTSSFIVLIILSVSAFPLGLS
jgi:hypothetical protein